MIKNRHNNGLPKSISMTETFNNPFFKADQDTQYYRQAICIKADR